MRGRGPASWISEGTTGGWRNSKYSSHAPNCRGYGSRPPSGGLKSWLVANPKYTVFSYTYVPMIKFNL